uniref:Uncharacterized protein n=1 Tax=Leersia perrieri TaxID=77586 RepID=A0A0D9XG64_9ORYZ
MALCAPPPQLLLACGMFGGGIDFTAAELAVADQLVQLSCSTGDDAASSSATSSPRSVNTTAFAANTSSAAAAEAEYEEFTTGMGDDEMELDKRARKRYRLLSDLYAATSPPAKRAAAAAGCRKRKRDGESPEIAGGE